MSVKLQSVDIACDQGLLVSLLCLKKMSYRSSLPSLSPRPFLAKPFSRASQQPITRREQLPCAYTTAFSRTSLFLERFSSKF